MKSDFDLSKILKLSDEELKTKISGAAALLGADKEKLNAALRDTGKLRDIIGSLTEKDVNILMKNIGEEKAKTISDILDNK